MTSTMRFDRLENSTGTTGLDVTTIPARSEVGLVPVIPTTVVVSGGTATVNSVGLVTFSGVSTVSLNGMFSSSYKNYRMLLTITSASGNTSVDYKLRASGVDWAGASGYIFTGTEGATAGGAFGNRYSNGQTSFSMGYAYTTYGSDSWMDIKNPYTSGLETALMGQCMSQLSSGNYAHNIAGRSNGNTSSMDGMTIIGASATISGNVQFYGYR